MKIYSFLLFIMVICVFNQCTTENSVARKMPLGATFQIGMRERGNPDSTYLPYYKGAIEISYTISSGTGSLNDPFVYKVCVENKQQDTWEGIIRFSLRVPAEDARFFLPGFLYGKNRGDIESPGRTMLYPSLRKGTVEIPYSPYWMVRSDRLSHPVAMMEVKDYLFGISGSPYLINEEEKLLEFSPGKRGDFYKYNGFACSMEDDPSISFTLGYENAPVLYEHSRSVAKREALGDNCMMLKGGETLNFDLYLYSYQVGDSRGINEIVRDQYRRFHELPRKGPLFKEAVEDITLAIFNDAYMPELKNYATQVFLKDDKIVHNPLSSISWTGGVEIATPLLLSAIRLEREDIRQQAIECIDHIVDNSLNVKSGLPYDAFSDGEWTTRGWWQYDIGDIEGHSSYLVGQAMYYILKAYHYEKVLKNVVHEEWLNYAEKVLMRIEQTKSDEGEYPYLWSSENGDGIDYDAFSGAWCMASIAYLSVINEDSLLVESSIESEEYYFNKYVKKMECYGTPLDTWKAVDSEGILAYIKTVKLLHEFTGDDKYIDRLKDGLEYEFTFKFCYNSPVQIPPLDRLNWSSSGGSITSTCNPHIHPMSNNTLDELYYCYNNTNDVYFKDRLIDAFLWGLQSYNTYDGEFDFGKKGWMSERFCHSQGLLDEKYPDGSPSSTWFCFLPWGASNVLEGMCGDLWASWDEFCIQD